MATEVILPRVDMDMAEGKIAFWYVKNGDTVSKGQVLFDIETDKATMEVDSPVAGVIEGIGGEVGVAMPVGQVVAWIVQPGEVRVAQEEAAPAPVAAAEAVVAARPEPVVVAAVVSNELLRATPLARSQARERGIDLGSVTGTGPRGRITASDLAGQGTTAASTSSPMHLHWWQRGEGAPLVLIHGFGADHASWRPLVQQLGNSQPVLGIDLPNHGKSTLQAVESVESLARQLGERLAQEGVTRCHLLGHSLGGAVALALALSLADSQPGLARSLTLLAPAGLGREIHAGFVDGLLNADSEDQLKATLSLLFVEPQAVLSRAFVAAAYEQLKAPGRQAALRQMAGALMPGGRQAADLRSALGALQGLPVKLVWGQHDRILPATHAAGVPGRVALHLLPEVGHLPQLEATALVAELVGQQIRASN